jgi:hypothetical protein
MLKIQEALRNGKTHLDLKSELGINYLPHPTLPLVIMNYDQIESPKGHPIVREARGLILRKDNHEIVAKSFFRFFNWGEMAEEMNDFNFNNFIVQTKEDGSLLSLWNFEGQWYCSTRGSYATDTMQFMEFTWTEGVCKALGVKSLNELNGVLSPDLTYVCEFVSPWNKVVRSYKEPRLILLSAFRGEVELGWHELDAHAEKLSVPFARPTRYEFKNIDEIIAFLNKQGTDDPTYEGVVIRDDAGRRWKIKSSTYLSLHKMRGEGDNLFNPKYLVPWALAGEGAELLVYFPEVTEKFNEVKGKVDEAFKNLERVWKENWKIEGQKEFALAIVKQTGFSNILFDMRKEFGSEQKLEQLKEKWRNAESVIIKRLF